MPVETKDELSPMETKMPKLILYSRSECDIVSGLKNVGASFSDS